MFELFIENPRIPKTQMAKALKINPCTVDIWFNDAVAKKIINPPIFRRFAFENFREHIYFLNVKHPHQLFEELHGSKNLTYFSVQTGFANFQVISKVSLPQFEDCAILKGFRSDYYVTVPSECTLEHSISRIKEKLENLDSYEWKPSPLKFHDEKFEAWDDVDEKIYWMVVDNYRKPIREIIREIDTYSDKVIFWFQNKDQFGQVITMYFPDGEGSYLLSLFSVKTDNDALLIDLFSHFPMSNVFYRVNDRLMMLIYLPFVADARIFVRKILFELKKRELVEEYSNSIVEYGHRP
ncbi:MAG: hypothetical protein HXS54_01470 [Theionarchaea archaeon]|nr:hypothetical protein [Theionarchaea archaeon]